jgi:hypothetical protein
MLKATLALTAAATLLMACEPPATGTGGTAASAPAPAAGDLSPPAGLTRDELTIWNALADDKKAEAKKFIADGGTFRDFYSI